MPTVSTKSVLLVCIVDTEEHQYVATVDIPNAFVQIQIEDYKDMSIIKIRVVLVDIMLEIYPYVYGTYVTTDLKFVKQIIVQFQNVIYSKMKSSQIY